MGKRIVNFTYACAAFPWVITLVSLLTLFSDRFCINRRLLFGGFHVKMWIFSFSFSLADFIKDQSAFEKATAWLGEHASWFVDAANEVKSLSISEWGSIFCVVPDSNICSATYIHRYSASFLVIFYVLSFITTVIGCLLVRHHWKSGEKHNMQFKSKYMKMALWSFLASSFFAVVGFIFFSYGAAALMKALFEIFTRHLHIPNDVGFHYSWFIQACGVILTILPIVLLLCQETLEEYDPDDNEFNTEGEDLQSKQNMMQGEAMMGYGAAGANVNNAFY